MLVVGEPIRMGKKFLKLTQYRKRNYGLNLKSNIVNQIRHF